MAEKKPTVNMGEVSRKVAELLSVTRLTANMMVQTVFEEIISLAQAGNKVSINKFGSFEVITKPERAGRNPKTGDAITIAAHDVFKFKVSPALQNSIAGK